MDKQVIKYIEKEINSLYKEEMIQNTIIFDEFEYKPLDYLDCVKPRCFRDMHFIIQYIQDEVRRKIWRDLYSESLKIMKNFRKK